MPTPSGQISFANLNYENGFANTTTVSTNDFWVRDLAGAPSGQVSLNALRSQSSQGIYFLSDWGNRKYRFASDTVITFTAAGAPSFPPGSPTRYRTGTVNTPNNGYEYSGGSTYPWPGIPSGPTGAYPSIPSPGGGGGYGVGTKFNFDSQAWSFIARFNSDASVNFWQGVGTGVSSPSTGWLLGGGSLPGITYPAPWGTRSNFNTLGAVSFPSETVSFPTTSADYIDQHSALSSFTYSRGYFNGGLTQTGTSTFSSTTGIKRINWPSGTLDNNVINLSIARLRSGSYYSASYGYVAGGLLSPSPGTAPFTVDRINFSSQTRDLAAASYGGNFFNPATGGELIVNGAGQYEPTYGIWYQGSPLGTPYGPFSSTPGAFLKHTYSSDSISYTGIISTAAPTGGGNKRGSWSTR